MRRTIDEIAETLGLDKKSATGLVDFLVETKLAAFIGRRFNKRKNGPYVYELVEDAGKRAAEIISRLE